MQSLAEKCPKLHYLCLSGCSALTDVALIALAQQCPLLSTLEVAGCTQFTDAAFQALARVSIYCFFFNVKSYFVSFIRGITK